ncbi:MAG: NAD(P)-dependent oxidoreductase [Desulfamplus sp.]|nr:NAD(P)-dependent oxidoreductase [Desulfamplus sp.]
MRTTLVTGATGKIGPLLVAELLRHKFRVRILLKNRSTSFIPIKKTDVEIFYGDITDYSSVLTAVSGVDYVFHLAALLHINNPPPSMSARYHDVNVIGTQNVIEASFISGVERVVFFSTISVYGAGLPGQIFYETSQVRPMTVYAQTKLLAESKSLGKFFSLNEGKNKEYSLYSKKVPDVTILRLASVYGARVTGNYRLLIQAVKKGFFCIPVSDINTRGAVRTLIHEEDVVSAAIIAATHKASAGKIYNLTDGGIHSLEEIVKSIASALSVKIRIYKISDKPFQRISSFIHSCQKVDQPFLKNIEHAAFMLEKLVENVAVDGYKIQSELGFKPKYSLKNGWQHSLTKCRANLFCG